MLQVSYQFPARVETRLSVLSKLHQDQEIEMNLLDPAALSRLLVSSKATRVLMSVSLVIMRQTAATISRLIRNATRLLLIFFNAPNVHSPPNRVKHCGIMSKGFITGKNLLLLNWCKILNWGKILNSCTRS